MPHIQLPAEFSEKTILLVFSLDRKLKYRVHFGGTNKYLWFKCKCCLQRLKDIF